MKKILLFAIFAFLFASIQAVEEEDGVLVLTDANFDTEVAKHQFILVEFYAPWCGHCKKLAPQYSAAAKKLKEGQNPIPLAKVDATQQKKLADQFEIKSFPTLKWITNKGANKMDYGGGRTTDEIVQWINKKTGPVSKKLQDMDSLKKFKEDNKVAVVYMGKEEDAEFNLYTQAASNFEKIAFAHFDCCEQCQKELETQGAKLVLFKKFDNNQDNFKDEFTVQNLSSFISNNSVPTVIIFDESYIEEIFGKAKTTLFLFSDANSQTFPQYLGMMKNTQGKDKSILYSVSDAKVGIQQKLAEFVGVGESDLPIAVIVKFKGQAIEKFRMKGQISEEALATFIEDFKADKLSPHFKSQEIPTEELDDGVKVLVGKNFSKQVFESGKDYFVKFYAPWCGHCKALAPKWADLGKQINVKGSNLVIAKFDATENEAEGVSVQGFPTLHFYKNGNKEPVVYSGERETADLLKFLRENSTVPEIETDL